MSSVASSHGSIRFEFDNNQHEWVPDLATRFYIAGLRSGAASRFVYHRRPKTLNEAIAAAEEFDVVSSWRNPVEEGRLRESLVTESVCDPATADQFAAIVADMRHHSAETPEKLLAKERRRRLATVPNRRNVNSGVMSISWDLNESNFDGFFNITYDHSLLRIDSPLPEWMKKIESRLPLPCEFPGIWQ